MKFGKKIGKKVLSSFLTAALIAGGIMWSPLALSVKAADNTAVSLGKAAVISKGQYKFGNAEVSGGIKMNMVNVSVDKGSLAVASDSSYQIIYDNLSLHQNVTLKMNTSLSAAEVQTIIREKITFTVPQGQQQSVNVTVDGNTTNIPSNIKVTSAMIDGQQHHYMYVEDRTSWSSAYNKAKGYTYAGLQGYLVTITSEKEDEILDNITSKGGWSGGSRRTASVYDQNSAPAGSTNQYFRWACGPEAGTEYYYYNNPKDKRSYNGAYSGFKDNAEPNNYNPKTYAGTAYNGGDYEWCMQVHAPVNNSSSWNDLNDTPGVKDTINGYFVEFSSYAGHAADAAKQAKAKATVAYGDTLKNPTPKAVEDQAKDVLNGLNANEGYEINGAAYVADANGQIAIADSWYGITITIVHKGNGSDTKDSDAQSLSLTLTDKKEAAKNQVQAAYDDAAAQVNALKNISENERKAFTNALGLMKEDSNSAIDEAKNKAEIANALKNAVEKITEKAAAAQNADKTILDTAKDAAKTAVDEKSKEVKEKIDRLENLSADEKNAEKAKVETAADAAKAGIDQKATTTEVGTQKEAELAKLADLQKDSENKDKTNLQTAKANAVNAVKEKADAQKGKLDANENLTDEQKNAAVKEIEDAAQLAEDIINNAANVQAVKNAQQNAENSLDELNGQTEEIEKENLQNAKEDAKSALESKVEDIKKQLDALVNLSAEQKEEAINAVDNMLADSLQDVDVTDTIPAISDNVKDFADKTEALTAEMKAADAENLNRAQQAAIEELEAKAEEAKAEINNLADLSDAEKETAVNGLDALIDSAKDSILGLETITGVEAVKSTTLSGADAFVNAVKEIGPKKLQDAKDAAKKEIDNKNAAVQSAIDAMQYLSASEKAEYKAQADQIAVSAKADIDSKKKIDEIQPVKEAAIAELDKISDSANQKDSVNKDIAIANNNGNNGNGNNSSGNSAVKTGDTTNMFSYAAALFAAIIAMAAGVHIRRRSGKR